MESTWNPSGVQWNYRIHLESSGMVVESTSSFHVDSIWNIGGIESPKRVGSQPKYIPSGKKKCSNWVYIISFFLHFRLNGMFLKKVIFCETVHGPVNDDNTISIFQKKLVHSN